jgi:AmmeMemoRadiSam system protein A
MKPGFIAALLLCVNAAAAGPWEELRAQCTPEQERQVVALARQAVETFVRTGQTLNVRSPAVRRPLRTRCERVLRRRLGVFVTLNLNGRVRGCLGTTEPRQANLAEEIIHAAIGAATKDSRFHPVTAAELPRLRYEVSVVGPLRQVHSVHDLQPWRLGLLVRSGGRTGLLLPKEAKTARWQLAECKRKGGIPPDADVTMFVFETVVMREM